MAAAKAYIAAYGEVRERFQQTDDNASKNPALSLKVNCKSIQDRYKKIQESFGKDDAKKQEHVGSWW